MSAPEESPAQRAARLRRERREAKIKDGGSARLDKITSLSGRTPQPGKLMLEIFRSRWSSRHVNPEQPLTDT